jgi:hypothetical protein
MLKRLPLWTYRVMPTRWVRWIYREELERGRKFAESMGWTD